MTKIVFNPEFCADFMEKDSPALIVITDVNVQFNGPASKLLAVKKGSRFLLEMEGNELFYVDSVNTGFEIKTELIRNLAAPAKGLLRYLLKLHEITKIKSLRYSIGEFNNGRRKLTEVA